MKKGQAIEAVGKAVLLTTNGTPNVDTITPITGFTSCDGSKLPLRLVSR